MEFAISKPTPANRVLDASQTFPYPSTSLARFAWLIGYRSVILS